MMCRRITAVLASALSGLAVARMLPAQVLVGAGAGGLMERSTGDAWRSATQLAPSLRIETPWAQISGDGSLVLTGGQWRAALNDVRVIAESPSWHFVRLTGESATEWRSIAPDITRGVSSFSTDLSARDGGTGAWFGVGTQRRLGTDSVGVHPLLRAGVWQQVGLVSLVLGTEQHEAKFSEVVVDTLGAILYARSSAHRWSDANARVSWTSSRVAVEATIGLQPRLAGIPSSLWSRASATVAIAPRLSAVVSAGNEAPRPWVGMPASRFGSFGFRVAPPALARAAAPSVIRPVAASFAIRPDSAGAYVITVRVPDARTVEVSGDFDSWRPIALHATSFDTWETTAVIAPGTHHVNLRINGDAWIVPPGLAQATDDFGGSVGLLVVY